MAEDIDDDDVGDKDKDFSPHSSDVESSENEDEEDLDMGPQHIEETEIEEDQEGLVVNDRGQEAVMVGDTEERMQESTKQLDLICNVFLYT